MDIGLIGVGVVGGATKKVFEKIHKIHPYDKYKTPYNFEDNMKKLAKNSEVVFVCVPTPMKPSGEIDYSAIHNSIRYLKRESKKTNRNLEDLLVVIRSTAVSGTTDNLEKKYSPLHFAFNPEFLTEKNALQDMLNTDRVVIGANREQDAQKLESVYKPIFPDANYIHVNRKTAEMIKYAANVMLAGQIALANELYNICNSVGVDYTIVQETISLDNRIGKNIKVPGPDGDFGFGGKCFPKDLNALIYLARENMCRPHLLEEIWRSNLAIRKKKDWIEIPRATSNNKNFKKSD